MALAVAAAAGNALYAFGEPGGLLKDWSPAIVASALVGYMVVHGRGSYTGQQMLTFAVVIFIVGWSLETLSILTGFPFGNYHYTALMEPFIGHVPVFVMPAYCVMGYVSWSMARVLVGRPCGDTDTMLRWAGPVVAAALMVVWDLSMDPLRATVEQRWIWLDGGSYLGVPSKNYAGWALVTWLMFQSFALLLPRGAVSGEPVQSAGALFYWLSVPLAYASFGAEYLLNPLFADASRAVVLLNGVETPVAIVFRSVALITASTMMPLAIIASVLVFRRHLIVRNRTSVAAILVEEERR